MRAPPKPPIPDTLTAATWTQGAEELDQLVIRVQATVPAEADCTDKAEDHSVLPPGQVLILVDGNQQAELDLSTGESEKAQTVEGSSWLFEPGEDTKHTLTAQVIDQCGAGGGNGGGHFKIDSLSIDALGAS